MLVFASTFKFLPFLHLYPGGGQKVREACPFNFLPYHFASPVDLDRQRVEKMQRCPAFGRRLTSYSDSQLSLKFYLPRIYPEINKKRVLYVFIPWLWFSASGEHGKSELKSTISYTFSSLLPNYFISRINTVVQKAWFGVWLAERKISPAMSNQKSIRKQKRFQIWH